MRSYLFLVLLFLPSLLPAQRPWDTCGRSTVSTPKPLVPVLVTPAPSASHAFDLMNAKRARSGKGPFIMDAEMQEGAQIKVERAAKLGITGHQGGSFYGGNKEGVGWNSGQEDPLACYLLTAPEGTPAGFAMAHGRKGWHSVLLIKHNGYLPSGSSGPVRRMVPSRPNRGRFFRRFRRWHVDAQVVVA